MHGAELRHLNSRYSRPRVLLSNARNSKAVLFKSALRKLRARGLTTLRYVWQRLATLGYVWIRADTFEYIWKRVDMFNYVWLHFGAVWQQFGNIWQHLTSNWIQLAMIWQQTWKSTPLWTRHTSFDAFWWAGSDKHSESQLSRSKSKDIGEKPF